MIIAAVAHSKRQYQLGSRQILPGRECQPSRKLRAVFTRRRREEKKKKEKGQVFPEDETPPNAKG